MFALKVLCGVSYTFLSFLNKRLHYFITSEQAILVTKVRGLVQFLKVKCFIGGVRTEFLI